MSLPTTPFRRTWATMVVAALAGLLSGGTSGCGVFPATEPGTVPVMVAADLELSGPGAAAGTVLRRALELRVEQVNSQGLLPGRELVLAVRDNGSSAEVSVTNLTELAADERVSAIVAGGCAACVIEAVPALEAAGVPTIALAPGAAVAAPVAQRRYVFQLAPSAADTAELLTGEMVARDLTTVGLVTVAGSASGPEAARELAAAAEAVGVELVVQERVAAAAGEEELAALADRLAGWRPAPVVVPPVVGEPSLPPNGLDAVVLWTPGDLAGQLAVELRRTGWPGQLLLEASAAGSLFLTGDPAQREALAGARLVFTETLAIDQTIATSPAKAARQAWWREYLARHGDYDAYASFAADAVGVVVAAIARMDSTDRETLRDTIEAISLDGLSGPIRFTPDSHSGLQPLALTVLVAAGDRWRLAG